MMKFLFIILLVVLGFSGLVWGEADSGGIDPDSAREFYEKYPNAFNEVVTYLNTKVEDGTGSVKNMMTLAEIYYEFQGYVRTEKLLKRVLEIENDNADALKMLTAIYIFREDNENGKIYNEKLAKLKPESEIIKWNKIMLTNQKREYAKALELCRQMQRSGYNKKDGKAYLNYLYGIAYLGLDQRDKAEARLGKLKLDNNNHGLINSLEMEMLRVNYLDAPLVHDIKITHYEDPGNWAGINNIRVDYEIPKDINSDVETEDPNKFIEETMENMWKYITASFTYTNIAYWEINGKAGKYKTEIHNMHDPDFVTRPDFCLYSDKLEKILLLGPCGIAEINDKGKMIWLDYVGDDNMALWRTGPESYMHENLFVYRKIVAFNNNRLRARLIDIETMEAKEFVAKDMLYSAVIAKDGVAYVQDGEDIVEMRLEGNDNIVRHEDAAGEHMLVGHYDDSLYYTGYDDGVDCLIREDGKVFFKNIETAKVTENGIFLFVHEDDWESIKGYRLGSDGKVKMIGHYDREIIGVGECKRGVWVALEDGTVKVFAGDKVIDERIGLEGMKK